MTFHTRRICTKCTIAHACHTICALSPLAALATRSAKNTQHHTSIRCCGCHAKWNWTPPKFCACHEKWTSSSESDAKVLPLPVIQNGFWHVMKHIGMSRSATPATQTDIKNLYWNVWKWLKMNTSKKNPLNILKPFRTLRPCFRCCEMFWVCKEIGWTMILFDFIWFRLVFITSWRLPTISHFLVLMLPLC